MQLMKTWTVSWEQHCPVYMENINITHYKKGLNYSVQIKFIHIFFAVLRTKQHYTSNLLRTPFGVNEYLGTPKKKVGFTSRNVCISEPCDRIKSQDKCCTVYKSLTAVNINF